MIASPHLPQCLLGAWCQMQVSKRHSTRGQSNLVKVCTCLVDWQMLEKLEKWVECISFGHCSPDIISWDNNLWEGLDSRKGRGEAEINTERESMVAFPMVLLALVVGVVTGGVVVGGSLEWEKNWFLSQLVIILLMCREPWPCLQGFWSQLCAFSPGELLSFQPAWWYSGWLNGPFSVDFMLTPRPVPQEMFLLCKLH